MNWLVEVNGLFPQSKLLLSKSPLVFSNSFLNQRIISGTQLTCCRYRWSTGESINKPLDDGSVPNWNTVRERYWKNRYQRSKNTGEFDLINLKRMQSGLAPQDYSFMTYKLESRELHHITPRRFNGSNEQANLLEVTPDEHAAIDPCRKRKYNAN